MLLFSSRHLTHKNTVELVNCLSYMYIKNSTASLSPMFEVFICFAYVAFFEAMEPLISNYFIIFTNQFITVWGKRELTSAHRRQNKITDKGRTVSVPKQGNLVRITTEALDILS